MQQEIADAIKENPEERARYLTFGMLHAMEALYLACNSMPLVQVGQAEARDIADQYLKQALKSDKLRELTDNFPADSLLGDYLEGIIDKED